MVFIVIVFVCIGLCFYVSSRATSGKDGAISIPEIHNVNSIGDIVMAVNHGRICPFFTRMNYIRAKDVAKKIHPNVAEFENTIQIQELMGIKSYFDLPISNNYIERVTIMFSKGGLVSSIGIDIKNFDINMKPLIEEMVVKFGKPTSIDGEFIIWREAFHVINISINGSLSVIDESIFGR